MNHRIVLPVKPERIVRVVLWEVWVIASTLPLDLLAWFLLGQPREGPALWVSLLIAVMAFGGLASCRKILVGACQGAMHRWMFLLLCPIPCFSGVLTVFLPLAPFGNDWRDMFYGLFSLGTSMLLTLLGIGLIFDSRRGIFALATLVASVPFLLVAGHHLV